MAVIRPDRESPAGSLCNTNQQDSLQEWKYVNIPQRIPSAFYIKDIEATDNILSLTYVNSNNDLILYQVRRIGKSALRSQDSSGEHLDYFTYHGYTAYYAETAKKKYVVFFNDYYRYTISSTALSTDELLDIIASIGPISLME